MSITRTEAVVCVFDDSTEGTGELSAIIHRDEKTGHKIVYMTKPATVDQMAILMGGTMPIATAGTPIDYLGDDNEENVCGKQ